MVSNASPSSTSPSLGAVIVSYNTRELLDRCLRSLLAESARSGLRTEVWVVDNASSDGSAELVSQRYPELRLVALESNVGFAAASNIALGHWLASPDGPRWLLLLNPDVELLPGALTELVGALAADPHAGAAGPRLIYGDGRFQHSAFRFPSLRQWLLDLFPVARLYDSRWNGRYPRAAYERGRPFVVDFPLGACLLMDAQAVRRVGLLDTSFFMYCEEVDWCYRLQGAGYHSLCVPGALAIHHAGASTSQVRPAMFVQLWRSRLRFVEKHQPSWRRELTRRILWSAFQARALADAVAVQRGRLPPEERLQRRAAYAAIFAP